MYIYMYTYYSAHIYINWYVYIYIYKYREREVYISITITCYSNIQPTYSHWQAAKFIGFMPSQDFQYDPQAKHLLRVVAHYQQLPGDGLLLQLPLHVGVPVYGVVSPSQVGAMILIVACCPIKYAWLRSTCTLYTHAAHLGKHPKTWFSWFLELLPNPQQGNSWLTRNKKHPCCIWNMHDSRYWSFDPAWTVALWMK